MLLKVNKNVTMRNSIIETDGIIEIKAIEIDKIRLTLITAYVTLIVHLKKISYIR